jgi:crotonobetainyl-CoA:carnitine CoA-transferase CaiB-like acyl-CoA transferase
MPGTPLDFSGIPRQPVRRAPLLGEHTEEVLKELGYSTQDIAALRAEGAI